jgi:hypothetical protein
MNYAVQFITALKFVENRHNVFINLIKPQYSYVKLISINIKNICYIKDSKKNRLELKLNHKL